MHRLLLSILLVIGVFGQLASPASAQDVGDLLSQIRQHEDRVERSVFARLGAIGTPEAFEALKKGIRVLRAPAGWSPAFMAFQFFRGEESQAEAIEYLMDAVMDEKGERSKYAMLALLTFELDAKAELLKILDKSKIDSFRARALKPLLEEFEERPTAAALRVFLNNYRPGLTCEQEYAVGFLNLFDTDISASIFEEALENKRTHLLCKTLILDALAENLDMRWENTLLKALSAKEEPIQLAALRGLEALESDRHSNRLTKLCKAKLSELRFDAYIARARLLGQDEEWLNEVRKMIKSKDSVQRQISAALSGMLPRDEAMEKLNILLLDSHIAVKIEALMAMGQLRRRDSVPILITRLELESGTMKWRVQKTLEMLTAKPFGPQVNAWKRWWGKEGADFVLPSKREAEDILYERDVWEDSGDTSAFYGLPVVSDRVIFILDTSGSMKTEHNYSAFGAMDETVAGKDEAEKSTRLDVAQKQLIRSLERMEKNVHFNVLFFDSKVRAMAKKLLKMSTKSRIESIQYVKGQKPEGATAIFDALKDAFRDPVVDTIYLLSDGQPAGGSLNDPHLIREKVRQWNRSRHITIHTISVGGEVSLLIWLAQDSGGEYILAD